MGRTVIRQDTATPAPSVLDERPGTGLGLALGILLGVLLVVLAVLLLRGTWNGEQPSPGTGNDEGVTPSAPAQLQPSAVAT